MLGVVDLAAYRRRKDLREHRAQSALSWARRGLVCAVLGLVVPGLGAVGLALSIVAASRAREGERSELVATVGIALGAVATVTGVLVAYLILA
jgi:flagellar motor component MotA